VNPIVNLVYRVFNVATNVNFSAHTHHGWDSQASKTHRHFTPIYHFAIKPTDCVVRISRVHKLDEAEASGPPASRRASSQLKNSFCEKLVWRCKASSSLCFHLAAGFSIVTQGSPEDSEVKTKVKHLPCVVVPRQVDVADVAVLGKLVTDVLRPAPTTCKSIAARWRRRRQIVQPMR